MTTTPPPWNQIKALFDAAAELPPAQREPLLRASGLRLDALAEVRSLLAHHDSATGTQGFMAAGAAQQLAATVPTVQPAQGAARTGQRLGAWQVVRAVGVGGMGEVFEARRADGSFEGRAAIKLLKRGMDSAAVLQRFALERQALARLSHPHIARLLDAGASPEGLPYFVLEFVDGRTIDEAVRGLPLVRRLQLFLQLADAVAYAHRNLLVHRDLKPGNVLVDGEGQVKLLDFGIAKALDPLEGHSGADGHTTVGGVRPYTPHYASPEQIRGEPVSTATDIYSLGVLLYQMLTGTRPTGRKASTPQEAARSVLADLPTRPSRLTASDVPDPQWLHTRKKLEGDLDNILLKALEKAPEQRYASVDALAADVTAYLEGRPVSARAASPGYVLLKWLKRHRAAALAGGLGSLGLLTGLAATLLQGRVALALGALGLSAGLVLALAQARRAQMARDEAARSRDDATRHLADLRKLANSMVFDVNDALEHGLTEGRRQLVHTAAQSLEQQAAYGQLTDSERLDLARALSRLARLEGHQFTPNLGHVPRALTHYERALQVLQPMTQRHQDSAAWQGAMATALHGHAAALRALKRAPQALASIERAAHHAARAAALAPADMAWRTLECATLVQRADHAYPVVRIFGMTELDAAQSHVAPSLLCSQQLVAWAPGQARAQQMRAYSLRMQAGFVAIAGLLREAVHLEQAAFRVLEQIKPLPNGPTVWATDCVPACVRMAVTMRAAGLYEEAGAAIDHALAHAAQRLRDDPTDEQIQGQYIASVQTALDLCVHRGQTAEALALYDTAMRTIPPLPGDDERHHRLWQHQWMDAVHTVSWVRAGDLARAAATVQRLHAGLALLKLRDNTGALDAELEANVHIADAYVQAAHGREPALRAAVQAAQERLQAMRTLRDPRDAIEAVRSWQLLVRLAQAPMADVEADVEVDAGAGAGADVEAVAGAVAGAVAVAGAGNRADADLQSALVAQARHVQAELVARGLVDAQERRESLWLAQWPL